VQYRPLSGVMHLSVRTMQQVLLRHSLRLHAALDSRSVLSMRHQVGRAEADGVRRLATRGLGIAFLVAVCRCRANTPRCISLLGTAVFVFDCCLRSLFFLPLLGQRCFHCPVRRPGFLFVMTMEATVPSLALLTLSIVLLQQRFFVSFCGVCDTTYLDEEL
jgi:hypothetical protein